MTSQADSTAPSNGHDAEALDEATTTANPEEEIESLRRQLAASQDATLRIAADLDNLQKRFQRELAHGQEAERRRVLLSWVESLDDLERALAHADQVDDGATAIRDGVRTIVAKAVAGIAAFGYQRFGSVGDVFDPELHQVVSTIPAGDGVPANVVVAVVTPGYGSADALLRPASVVVGKDAD